MFPIFQGLSAKQKIFHVICTLREKFTFEGSRSYVSVADDTTMMKGSDHHKD